MHDASKLGAVEAGMLVGMEEERREVRRKSVGNLADPQQRVLKLPMCSHRIANSKGLGFEAREGSANLHLDFGVSKSSYLYLSARTTEKQDIVRLHNLLVNSKESLHTKTKCILSWHRREKRATLAACTSTLAVCAGLPRPVTHV